MLTSHQTLRKQSLRQRIIFSVTVAMSALTAVMSFAPSPVAAASRNVANVTATTAVSSVTAVTSVAATTAVTNITATASCGTYIVRQGDWLSSIAARTGTSWQTLARNNGISNANLIFPGEHLALCGGGYVATVASHAAASSPSSAPASTSSAVAYSYNSGEMCHSGTYVAGPISQWAVPPSCYAGVYRPNPANYVSRSGFGWCNWWPEVLHPNNPRILFGARSSYPTPGAVAVFAPGDQGASAGGHYGEVVAVLGNGWILISEMNDTWRGAGFGLVNYRYVRLDGRVSFING